MRRSSLRTDGRLAAVESGGDDGDAHLVAEGVVDDGTEDDVRLGVHGLLHEARGVVDLEDAEVRSALDRQQHAVRAVDARLEQRGCDGQFGGLDRAVGAAAGADAHEGGAGALHDRLDVGEVEVDEAGRRDQVGDALHAGEQHLVGGRERLEHADAAVADLEQPVVGNDDEGVDLALEADDPDLGLGRTALALEPERLGDDTDGERADRLGDARDDRGAAGAGAAALARGDEDHVGAGEGLFDLFGVVLGGATADLGVGAGAEAAGEFATDVELDVGVAHQQRLGVGVDGDELHAAQAELDHAVDGVDAAAADADDLDHREVVLVRCHVRPPCAMDTAKVSTST